MLTVTFSNMLGNDQVIVNPPPSVSVSYVVKIKKNSNILHNQIEIIEIKKAIMEIESNPQEHESLHP